MTDSPKPITAIDQAIRISEHVYWVGAIDWALRDFHGYTTDQGSTYNAFLVLGEKIALIDTVKAPFKRELLARIASVIDPSRIDYIISNHAEMDHSGCLPELIEIAQPEKVFASPLGVKALGEHFRSGVEISAVKDGEQLSLGNLTLSFVETRMVHWPDSMFTYLTEDGVLFSNDGFGMHLASAARFDDEIDPATLLRQSAKYYANILLPFSGVIARLLEKVASLHLDLRVIAPDHGPVWRGDTHTIIERYASWAQQERTNKAVVVYDTMWQSTAKMAHAIAEGLTAGGTRAVMMPMGANNRSDVATEILDAGALLVGSPTLNNNMFPTLADVLSYVKGLKPKNLLGATFGSYGWSGEASGQARDILQEMGVEIVCDPLKGKFVPDMEVLGQCYALGQQVAQALVSRYSREPVPA